MSLDLINAALQIDRMVEDIKARQGDLALRLQSALKAISIFDMPSYKSKLLESEATLNWNVPMPMDGCWQGYEPSSLPEDFCVVAVDGSHIDIDRHLSARCFLINIGVAVLQYGSRPDAQLFSKATLYSGDDEVVIRDVKTSREQTIEGSILGAKRAVEEIQALAQIVKDIPSAIPTVALMDGTMIMMGLMDFGNRGFVLRELVEEGFVAALEDLRQTSKSRHLGLASYISLPGSTEVVNALRLPACPYEVADCDRYCGKLINGLRPCDKSVGGLRDRDLFAKILHPEERSVLFRSESPFIKKYYKGHDIYFFYVNTGQEIGRVEIPSWIAEDKAMLDLTYSTIVDQCRKGPGYPITLMEAHEQAVVTGSDRRYFAEMIDTALYDQRLPVYTSEKNRSKRLRWI